MEGTMSSSALHLKVKKALLVVAMLALYAAIRKGIYEDEDADEEEMGVLLCVVVVVGIARAGGIQVDADTAEHAAYSLESSNISLSLSLPKSKKPQQRKESKRRQLIPPDCGGNRRLNAARPCSLALCPFENCAGEVGEGDQCHAWIYRPISYQFSRLVKLRKISWGTLKRLDLGCVIPRPGCLAKGSSKHNSTM